MGVKEIREQALFEMASIPANRTGLPYAIWVDSAGGGRNVPHKVPRLKVRSTDGQEWSVALTKPSYVLAGRKDKFTDGKEVLKFVEDNVDVFLLHWNHQIDDTAIGRYCLKVGKQGKHVFRHLRS